MPLGIEQREAHIASLNKRAGVVDIFDLLNPKKLDDRTIIRILAPEIRALADSIGMKTIDEPGWKLRADASTEPFIELTNKCDIAPGIVETLGIIDPGLAPEYIEYRKGIEGVSMVETYSFYGNEAGKCVYRRQEGEKTIKNQKIAIDDELLKKIQLFLGQASKMVEKHKSTGDKALTIAVGDRVNDIIG